MFWSILYGGFGLYLLFEDVYYFMMDMYDDVDVEWVVLVIVDDGVVEVVRVFMVVDGDLDNKLEEFKN